MGLRIVLAEHFILCGDLKLAGALLEDLDVSLGLFFKSVILMLLGEQDAALTGFTEALKLLRRETGKRKMCFSGIGGHLYVLALVRSGDAKHDKAAEAYLDSATRAVQSHDTAVYEQLNMLRRIRGGTVDPDVLPSRSWETALQPFMFRALMHYWLTLPQLAERRAAIELMLEQHATRQAVAPPPAVKAAVMERIAQDGADERLLVAPENGAQLDPAGAAPGRDSDVAEDRVAHLS